ncbi:MAG: Uncharacterized conserved protein UCP033563 [Desulfotomaculum sp. 46_296]|nr:MAG: Uncharacterized conserved protein UCP033563 [Desulfotomaculum sp. 46_296]HAU30857.1 DUF1015 domain-containing protein [Desulfotomaculum sp.]
MANVIPFKGVRYSSGAGAMSLLITPPYDIINEKKQEYFYQLHPNNIIRLEYGKSYPYDTKEDNRHTRAAAVFSSWLKEGILKQETSPAIYLCQERFNHEGREKTRSSFICGVKLEPYEKGVIIPHEETIPKHKADRLSLMQACKANFSPIFGLYVDPDRIVEKVTCAQMQRDPDINFIDENNHHHSLWVVTDNGVISQVQRFMAAQRIFIADGHHRYETALAYRDWRRGQEKTPLEEHSYDYVMMSLVNLNDPGLVILPTHRLIRTNIKAENLFNLLSNYFDLEYFPMEKSHENLNIFISALKYRSKPDKIRESTQHRNIIGLYTGEGGLYLLTLKEAISLPSFAPLGHSPVWQKMDVSILHYFIFKELLAVGEEKWTDENHLYYSRNEDELLSMVDSGKYQFAFFLNPTFIEEMTFVALNGEKLPQKSTYFYPKIITGLVINMF